MNRLYDSSSFITRLTVPYALPILLMLLSPMADAAQPVSETPDIYLAGFRDVGTGELRTVRVVCP